MLPEDDLPIASALVAFCNSLGPTIAIAIGQSIFTTEVAQQLARVSGIDMKAVVMGGAAGPGVVAPGLSLMLVRQAFRAALAKVFVLSITSGGAAFVCSLAIEP